MLRVTLLAQQIKQRGAVAAQLKHHVVLLDVGVEQAHDMRHTGIAAADAAHSSVFGLKHAVVGTVQFDGHAQATGDVGGGAHYAVVALAELVRQRITSTDQRHGFVVDVRHVLAVDVRR